MSNFLLIDINNIGYSAMYQPNLASLQSKEGFCTSALHGAFSSLISIIKRYPNYTPVMLWDTECMWRKEILPEYKSNRHKTLEQQEVRNLYNAQVPVLRTLFSLSGVPQITAQGFEADDVAGSLILKNEEEELENKYMMVTADSDWFQGIGEHAHLFHFRNKLEIRLDNFLAMTIEKGGFATPEQYVMAKCLFGDKQTDCISGIDGIGPKTAIKYLEEYGSPEAIFNLDAEKCRSKKLKSLIEGRGIYERNRRLIDWKFAPLITDYELVAGFEDMGNFADTCQKYDLVSIQKNVELYQERNMWPTQKWSRSTENLNVE